MKKFRWLHRLPSIWRTIIITFVMFATIISALAIYGTTIYIIKISTEKKITGIFEKFIDAHKQKDIVYIASFYYEEGSDEYNALINGADDYFALPYSEYFSVGTNIEMKVHANNKLVTIDLGMSVPSTSDGTRYISRCYVHKRNGRWYLDPASVNPEPQNEHSVNPNVFPGLDSTVSSYMVSEGAEISDNTFYNCPKLKKVELPGDLESISYSWFMNCPLLTEVVIHPDNPHMSSVNGIVYSKDKTRLLYYPKGRIQNAGFDNGVFTIPSTVKIIAEYAFAQCISLKSITLPSSVETIEQGAFWGIRTLETIVFEEGLKRLDEGAFRDCAYLKSIHLPATLESIGIGAFSECFRLESVTAASGGVLSSIGHSAFEKCASLKTVALPDSVTEIGNWAFQDCQQLKTISVLPKLKSIGLYAFRRCIKLESFFISGTVTKIEKGAFHSCNALSLSAAHPEKPAGWASDWDNGYKNTVEWGVAP